MTIPTLRKVAALLATCAAIANAPAQTPAVAAAPSGRAPVNTETVAQLRSRLREIGARSAALGFSGTLMAVKGDSTIFEAQYGMADRELKRPNSANTLFNTGSLTKQFTAAAVLRLEMAGRLRTSDSIGKFFPGLPADKRGITVHHLLTHSSGLPDTDGGNPWATRDVALREIFAMPLEAAPGTQFRYANAGYNLLAAIIETASGMPYDQYLREQLFTPSGMTSTGMHAAPDKVSLMASYYMGEIPNGSTLNFSQGREWSQIGSGGVLTTSADMRRWINTLNSDRVLNAAARKKLFTPFLGGYAYGWGVPRSNAGLLIEHDGGNTLGVGAFVLWYKDAGVAVIGFCNDDGETSLLGQNGVRRHIRTALEGGTAPGLPAVTAASAQQAALFAGTYRTEGNEVTIVNTDGALRLIGSGQRMFAALAPMEVADSAFVALHGARALAGIQAAMRGDSMTAVASFIPRATGRLIQFGRAAQEEFGAFQRADVLGARLEAQGDDMTVHVRLHFANGVQYLRARVAPMGLAGLDFLRRAPSVPVAAAGPRELAFYAWGSGKVTRLRLEDRVLLVERDGVTTRLSRQ